MAVIPGTAVPEPATLSLLALGGWAFLRKRKLHPLHPHQPRLPGRHPAWPAKGNS